MEFFLYLTRTSLDQTSQTGKYDVIHHIHLQFLSINLFSTSASTALKVTWVLELTSAVFGQRHSGQCARLSVGHKVTNNHSHSRSTSEQFRVLSQLYEQVSGLKEEAGVPSTF